MIPLSFAQRRLWFLHRLEGPSATYNIPFVLRLDGPLDTDALAAAVDDVLARHESLRTLIAENTDGTPEQRILPAQQATCPLRITPTTPDALDDAVHQAAREGFDLEHDLPIRATVLRTAPDRHTLVFVFHHIAADGASMAPFMRDLLHAYTARHRGHAPDAAPLPVQYKDYTLWQRQLLGDEDDPDSTAAAQLAYWRRELAGVQQPVPLPLDRPRPTAATHRGGHVDFELDADLLAAVGKAAAERGATAPMVAQTALAVLLHHLGAGDDVTIGSPIEGRADEQLDDLIGFFANTWVLRTDLTGNPAVGDLLEQVRERALAAYDHQDLPFERLVELISPQRSTAYQPLFQVMLAWQFQWSPIEIPGLRVTPVPAGTGTAKFDLFFNIVPAPTGGAYGRLEYATDLFDAATAGALADRYQRILRQITADTTTRLADIDVLTDAEHRALAAPNATDRPQPPATVVDLVTAQAARTPHAPALTCADDTVTYRELEDRAGHLAAVLHDHGVGPETLVACALPRTADLAVALLGILKAGAAYLPIDPGYPPGRIEQLLNAADPALILTTAPAAPAADHPAPRLLLESLPAPAPGRGRGRGTPRPVHPDQLAYVMFTSGSTGTPKAVAVTHAGVVNGLRDLQRLTGTGPGSRMLAATSVSFDVSVFEIFTALTSGACADIVRDVLEVAERGTWTGTTLSAVPSLLAALLDPAATEPPGALRLDVDTVITAGEPLTADLARTIRTALPRARLINAYGQTESFYATAHTLPPEPAGPGPVPIGRPLANMRAHVLGPYLTPVPPGVTGDLYIAGPLARGYHADPAATAQRFVACPFGPPGTRMYRTGDLARLDTDGRLVYAGRADAQIKINGIRIEPSEIETVLARHPAVAQAAVTVHRDAAGTARLVAYLTPDTTPDTPDTPGTPGTAGATGGAGGVPQEAQLRRFAAGHLPDYMVPAHFVPLARLPLAANGKLDRAALPEPQFTTAGYRPPGTGTERVLAEVYADVLGADRVGVDDDFFTAGGDSTRSIQVVARARTRGVHVTTREVFEQRTVARLAEVADTRPQTGPAPLAELPGAGVGFAPLPPTAAHVLALGGGLGRFCMSALLTLPDGIDRPQLTATVQAVLDRHDVLRSRLDRDGPGLHMAPPGSVDAADVLREVPAAGADLQAELDAAAGRLDPDAGVMTQFVWLTPRTGTTPDPGTGGGEGGRLLVVLHHLAVDGVSWRILVPDLAAAWQRVRDGQAPAPPPAGTSLRRWTHALAEEAATTRRGAELPLWQDIGTEPEPPLGGRAPDPARDVAATVETVQVRLPAPVTAAVLDVLPDLYHGRADDGLLAALALAVARFRQQRGEHTAWTRVRLEGHGRADHLIPGADLSDTLGWFTAMFPVRLDVTGIDLDDAFSGGPAAADAVKAVKEQLRAVPDHGLGYGLLRHLNPATAAALATGHDPQIGFNYLGKASDADIPAELRGLGFTPDADGVDLIAAPDADMPALSALEINTVAVPAAGGGQELTAYFGFPTGVLARTDVEDLAALWTAALHVLADHTTRPGAGSLTPSDAPLAAVTQHDIDTWQQRLGPLEAIWPATPVQAGMLFHTRLAGTSFDAYHMQLVFHLTGDVDPERMRRAGTALLRRHRSLRAAFTDRADGDTVQIVPARTDLPWHHLDLTGLPEADRTERFEDFLHRDRTTHFDPAAPPLLRLALARLEPGRAELVLTAHHVLIDGWSTPLLLRDLLLLYAADGDTAAVPAPRDFADFLTWRARQDHQAAARAWAAELDGVQEPTLLAPGAAGPGPRGVGQVEVALAEDQARALARRAAEAGVTVNTLVQGAWALLLGQLTGRQDVVFGATVSGRPPQVPDVDAMVGMFINTLPVRVAYAPGETVAAVLGRLQDRQAALLDHHYYGLSEIQQATGVGTLFDTLVVFESYPVDRDALAAATDAAGGIAFTGLRPATATNYPLTLMAAADPHLQLTLQYAQDVFDAATVRTFADRLRRILRQLAGPGQPTVAQIDTLAAHEHRRLLTAFNDTAAACPQVTVPDLVTAQAARTPAAPAVTADGTGLTYRELTDRAAGLAAALTARGVGPETLVAVALPRSADLVVALLGVLAAGGAYLPADPAYPSARLAGILDEAAPRLVLTDSATAAALPPHRAQEVLLDRLDLPGTPAGTPATGGGGPVHPEQLAYVMYTSGSTGRPKGVAVPHATVVNAVRQLADRVGLAPGTRLLAGTSVNFDVSVFEIFATLAAGGTVEIVRDVLALGERDGWDGGVISTVPSAFAELLDHLGEDTAVRTVVFAGEALPGALARRTRAAFPGVRIVNAYGQSESFYATTATCPPAADGPGSVPLGSPLGNMRAYLLGPGLRPVPPGATGELYIGGRLARGYHNQAAGSAERFVADPYGPPGARMYRTGDLARFTAGGDLEYVARADAQVKVRGFRIEPAEVEAVLGTHPAVASAAVVARDDTGTGPRLVAYIVPHPTPGTGGGAAAGPGREELHGFAAERLPEFMVPAAFVVLDRLPLTPNGKLDRAALPQPEYTGAAYRAPRTAREETLAALFAEVLGADRVGVDDGFFELGGHSLLATRLISRARAELGIEIPIRAVFDHPTVAALAAWSEESAAPRRPSLRQITVKE